MPYINPNRRQQLDPLLNELGSRVKNVGELNYAICRLGVLLMKQLPHGGYASLSAVRGAMIDASDEFWRRLGIPYEELKRAENGDIFS